MGKRPACTEIETGLACASIVYFAIGEQILRCSLRKTKIGFLYGFQARFPLPELTARVDGRPVSITRQLGPLTRAINSGSGNRALRER